MKVIQYIKINHLFNRVAFASGVILTLLAIAIHLPIISNGEQEAQAAGSSDPSITMTFTNSTASVDLAVNSANGTFAESTDATSAKFSVSTTSASGYTLSISASDDTGNLVNGSETLASISSAISSAAFDNVSYNGKWGYKPSKLNSAANTNFIQSPTTEATTLDVTGSANNEANNYTIALGTRADYLQSTGEYSKNLVIEAVSNFTPVTCDNTKLCVQYDGNGLTYEHGELMNNVNYNSTTSQQTVTKTLHSDNVNDNGIATGNSDINIDQTKEATIEGASSVDVSLYYDTEGVSYDWVTLYAGADSVPSSSNDGTIGSNGNLTGKLGGNKSGYTSSYTTWNLWNNGGNPINSDTIKIHFVTDDYAESDAISYGYYAVITGTGTGTERTVASGEYATPTSTNAIFHGWSSTQTTAGGGLPSDVEYTDESEVMSNMPGNEGETKTLYAVWQQGYSITFNKDSNVSSIAVLDSDGNTVGTITSSGQSLTLAGGDTYTIKPNHTTGHVTNTIVKTSGAGTLNGKEFTVGAGAATISITSRYVTPMQNWNGCSSLAQGSTIELLDIRDSEIYLVGKLKDNKCWMLENLNLAGGTALSATDTDVYSGYISSFTTSNNLTKTGDTIVLPASSTSGFDTNNYSYVNNSGNKTNCGASGQNTPCYSYYSWDAATLGSGRTISTDNTDAPYSICPKGWRLPTAYSTSATDWQTADFYTLAHQYGLDSTTSTDESDNGFYTQAGPGTVPNFLLAGGYDQVSFYGGSDGFYWSATSGSDTDNAYYLAFASDGVGSAIDDDRKYVSSVRCLLAQKESITFTWDNNVTSVDIVDSAGSVVGTLTSSNTSIPLELGGTYTIKPTHTTGYGTDTIAKASGAGTLNGNKFTVGAGTATINITSKYVTLMQNWNGCSSLAQGSTIELLDTRDNEVYLVGKLADNKCWLLDNLRLDLTNESIRNALTASNTNATATSLTSLRSGNRTAGAQYASSGFATWAVGDTVNAFNQAKANADYKDQATISFGSGSGKIGVYYNYCAASAGSYCYDEGAAPDDTNASQDICPAGWRMPTGGEWRGEYEALLTAYNNNQTATDTDSFQYNLSTPLSGGFEGGSAYAQGGDGYFWSSTWQNEDAMYFVDVYSSGVGLQGGDWRYDGISVRCLLK